MAAAHLLVIDAQSLAARAAHVANGDPVAGVRLWCQMARGAAQDVGATHLAAAWDHDGPTFRHALYDGYKQRRTGETRARVAPIRAALEATGLLSLSVDGFEGDDVVASVMARYRTDLAVTLLSNDSDLLQFVSAEVAVVSYMGVGKGTDGARVRRWQPADVLERFGVSPAQLPDFKALAGEAGDDIPGVPRIGKDTAVKLLRRWQSLEGALAASEFVSHRDDTAKLAGQHDHARLMRALTTIRTDVPLPPFPLEACALPAIRWPGERPARHAEAGPGLEEVPWPE